MESAIQSFMVNSVSTADDGTKYLKLFSITGPLSTFSILVLTGHNNTYTTEGISINSDATLLQVGAYNNSSDYKINKDYEWKIVYSNVHLFGKPFTLVIGYEQTEDGKREYGIYMTQCVGCKVLVFSNETSYQVQNNFYFDPKEVLKENVQVIKGQHYQNDYKSLNTPCIIPCNGNNAIVSIGSGFVKSFTFYTKNIKYLYIDQSNGYVTQAIDANKKDIPYIDNIGYDLTDAVQPITIAFYHEGTRDINNVYGNYYFLLWSKDEVNHKQTLVYVIPYHLENIVYISSLDDIKKYGRTNCFYAFKNLPGRLIFCYGRKDKDNYYLLEVSNNACLTENRPSDALAGYMYFDKTLQMPIWSNGNGKWIDANGNPADAKKKGTTEERPSGVQIGYIFKDTSLGKLIIWDGSSWVNMDGTQLS